MLKKVEAKCKRCKKDFYKKRTEQEFCSAQCWNAAWKKPRKRRLQGIPRGSVANGPFCSSKSVACEPPFTPDLGAFCEARSSVNGNNPIRLASLSQMPAKEGFGLPVIDTAQNLSVMIAAGASMLLTYLSWVEKSTHLPFGGQQPRRCAGQ